MKSLMKLYCFLIFLLIVCCEGPIEDEYEDIKIPKMFDLSGIWDMVAWYPTDCPECVEYRYNIDLGLIIFDSSRYELSLYYTFHENPNTLIETGNYVHSSYYFNAWYVGSMFEGEIQLSPIDGPVWSFLYRTGRPPNQYNEIIFKNFTLRNDTTAFVMYWTRRIQ